MPHWLLECDAWCIEQQPFLQCMRRIINDFDSHGDDGKHMIGIPYGRKFWRGIYFGGLAVLRAIRQYFIRQKLHSVMYHYCEIIVCALAAAKRASLIVGMEFTIESCVRGHRFSKQFCTPKEKNWLVCQRDDGDSNDVRRCKDRRDENSSD